MMKDPATREHFLKQGADPIFTTPQEMLQMIEAEYGRFGQAIKLAGLKVQ
jgi:tripartite-type tricarboxylate transporter receptor subunit TctC